MSTEKPKKTLAERMKEAGIPDMTEEGRSRGFIITMPDSEELANAWEEARRRQALDDTSADV